MFRILIFILLAKSLFSQKLIFGLGVEVNRTSFTASSPDILVPFRMPFTPSLGLAGQFTLEYKITKNINLYLNPSFGNQRMKWADGGNKTFLKMTYLNLGLGTRYSFNGITVGAEIGGSKYNAIFRIRNDQYHDLTNFITNELILNTAFFLGVNVHKDSYIYFKRTGYHQDVFKINTYDSIGREVGPVFLTPSSYSIGLKYYFDIFDKKEI